MLCARAGGVLSRCAVCTCRWCLSRCVEQVCCVHVQVVFGRVPKSASAPASPCVSRASTPGPADVRLADFDNDDDDEAGDDDELGEEADSEEEREELSRRDTPPSKRAGELAAAPWGDATTSPAADSLPAHSA